MPLIPPSHENLEGPRATKPLTAWLVHAAKRRGSITYGHAKARLENECGFDTVFTVAVGRVAGAAVNRILAHRPKTPLLNVLLVGAGTGLPGAGAVGYLANRYPARRWLRGADAHEDHRRPDLIEEEAGRVYAYLRWEELYCEIYKARLPIPDDDVVGTERDGTRRGGGGEGPHHRALRLRVTREPGLVRRGLRADATETEVELYSGDRVDVVSKAGDRTVAIEVKSRDSKWTDLRRGVFQCVKYRAVLAAQDIRREPAVETWLVTERPLPGDLKALARRLGVRAREIAPG